MYKLITVKEKLENRDQFRQACLDEGSDMSAELRKFIRRYIRRHKLTKVNDNREQWRAKK